MADNIELSSAADHAQRPKFLTGQDSQLQAASKATAPTICYVQPLHLAATFGVDRLLPETRISEFEKGRRSIDWLVRSGDLNCGI
jgi:hypothetical protein